ncbi:MAG: magnesium-translocating P-type ATPase [Anaerolineae bacterium]|nr:magnesium-translocating P-type ATPase [Anaerolineae bacterium]
MAAHPDPLDGYWRLPTADVEARLSATADGLTSADAARRLATYGANSLDAKRKETPLRVFLRQFESPIVLILIFATLMSALLGDWIDALIIALIVVGSALLSFVQEYNAGNATARLLQQVQLTASVVRDGTAQALPTPQIVPGDVVLLSAGSLIPADALVIEAKDLFVNQAVLTGETFPVEKMPAVVAADGLAERTNTVFMGTSVSSGSGRALVVHTGKATAFGQIASRLELRPPQTEFERGIRRLGYLLTEVMFVLVIVIFALNVLYNKPVLDSLLFSVALAVGLTPQLLPAIININLSKGAQRMAAEGVIVRRLNAIENFGSMDVLCTDKTGTLTLGVVQLDAANGIDGQPSDDVLRAAYLNAHLQTGLANPLDAAILAAGKVDVSNVHKHDEIPYDFVRKRLSVIVEDGGQWLMLSKGALESVLAACSQVTGASGIVPLDNAQLSAIRERFAGWSAQGFRVLGVARKPVEPQTTAFNRGDEHDMIFLGFLLFFDPPKPDVVETIRALADLGVSLKIITGDNRLVAQHAAETIGLPLEGVLTGDDMRTMRDEALWHAAPRTTLFAEVDPNQKERIILALQKTGCVVGYMGDGVNDAPALHAADVGISVDSAVDVAREAADFVLLEHSLAVLKQGILEGRRTFANTLKYVFMATSANFGNMFSVAGASLFLPFLPLLPKQILLLNFLTDLPELTIARDNVDDMLIRTPRRWNIAFIRRFMLTFGTLSSVFDYLTFGALLLLLSADADLFRTGWFIESIVSAVLVVFALRTRLPFTRSRPGRVLMVASAVVALIAVLLPYTPLAPVLGFQALDWQYLLAMLIIALLYFAAAEGVKRWFYRHLAAGS